MGRQYTGTEYNGKRRRNTLAAKDRGDNLSASEQLRLAYQTGQMTNVDEPTLVNWLDPTGPTHLNGAPE